MQSLPRLVSPRAAETIDAVRSVTGGGFDIDAYHAMNERDNALVEDEILHGAGSSSFVYQFDIQNQTITGVSVVGARHLASRCGGLKHRLVASMQKTGELFIAQSFPGDGQPMQVSASVVMELADQPDFYAAVVELVDLKSGNSIQVERREFRFERRRDNTEFERPNYQTIAQSKAYRNAVLSLVPQDLVIQWKAEMLRLRKGENITASVIGEKRANVLRFAAAQGLAIDRRALEHLRADQISGLGDAARQGTAAFANAARGLGLAIGLETAAAEPAEAPRRRGRPPKIVQPQEQERPRPEPSSAPAGDDLLGVEREPGEEG